MSDEFLFAEEDETSESEEHNRWKVLIVDDEPEMHSITRLALSDFQFQDKSIDFLSAYSGEEAKQMMVDNPDIAVILLDVVMETDDAGLRVAEYIRDVAKNSFVRIILRTGQPGQAPEKDVIVNYEINDYKSKTELTAQKLFTVIFSALRSYRDIRSIDNNRKGLEKVIKASTDLFSIKNLEQFIDGIVQQLSSILRSDESAYMVSSAVCGPIPIESKITDSLYIFSGQGDYSEQEGKPISDVLQPPMVDACKRVLLEKNIYYGDDFLVAYCRSSSDLGSIFYMSGLPNRLSDNDRDLLEIFAQNVQIAFENILCNREIEETQKELIFRVSEALEIPAQGSSSQARRFTEYARLFAELLHLTPSEKETLTLAIPLHDIGNIRVDSDIFSKPGELEPEERKLINQHTDVGYAIFKDSHKPVIRAAGIIAHEHHERWDGTGYPNNKKGEEIHLFARITAIIDVYDALRSERSYKRAMSAEQAADIIRNQSGKQFEPKLVDLMLANFDRFERIFTA